MFTCKRAKETRRYLGLVEIINQAIILNRLGYVVIEELLRNPRKSLTLGQLGLQVTILVAAWYIWWQHREAVKGENIAPVAISAFSIQDLTLNDGGEAIAGGAWPKSDLLDAPSAEAEARRHGISPVIVELDCMEFISALNKTIEIWSPFTAILADCFHIVEDWLVAFKHCPTKWRII
jgi:hypothetical protein